MTPVFPINETLATCGLEEHHPFPMKYVQCKIGKIGLDSKWTIVDVRPLLDDYGNSLDEYKLNITRVQSYLDIGECVVVCCSAGISRSPSIAVGTLVKYYRMDFYDALELVKQKVRIAQIAPCHIEALKKIFKVKI